MQAEVIAAIVTAVAGLVFAIVNLFVSRDAKKTAERAEELSKRTEQVRIKATEWGEKLLSTMADIIIQSETILFYIKDFPGLKSSNELTIEYLPKMAKSVGEIRTMMYSSALYTTPDIRNRISTTLEPFHRPGGIPIEEPEKWELFVKNLRRNHSELVDLFFNRYLKGALPSTEETGK